MVMKKIKEILVIDDDPIARKLVSKFLPATEFNVEQAENISEAVDYLVENTPHVILLDLMLPDMSGLEFQKECKDLIPEGTILIILSSRSEKKVINNALSNGAHDYIIKPPNRIDLLATVKKHLKNQTEFSKSFENSPISAEVIIDGELMALGETNLIIKSSVKYPKDEELCIDGEFLDELGIKNNQYITMTKYDHRFDSAKYTGITFRGASNNTIKKIRSMVIHWNKVYE
jgi:CheY-like chemotaxis protein